MNAWIPRARSARTTLPARATHLRRLLVVPLAVLAMVVPLATASAADLSTSTVAADAATTGAERLAGNNRYGTSAAVADEWAPGVGVAYVVSGQLHPDALVAAARAGAHDMPVLLTAQASVPRETDEALRRLKPGRIVVVGGAQSVSDSVLTTLRSYATSGVVERVAGADRYATAAAVASQYDARPARVYLANGQDFPDALSAAAVAGHQSAPLLLTRPDRLSVDTLAQLERLAPGEVVVVGGEQAVSDAVAQQAASHTGKAARRVAGSDRYHTAAQVAKLFPAGVSPAYIASGEAFPDALVGSALAARAGVPLLLTPTKRVHSGTTAALDHQQPSQMYVLGGTGAVADATVEQLVDAARNEPSSVVWPAMSSRKDATGISVPGVEYLFSASSAERNKVFDDIARLGVGWVRFDVPLFMVERTPGTRDWSKLDAIVASAKQRNLKVLVSLTALPTWARTDISGTGFADWQEGARTDTQRRAFRDFARAAADRYDGSVSGRTVDVWELWNEPNITAFWAPSPSTAHYAELVRMTYPAMREETTAPVIAGGTGGTSGRAPNIRTTEWYRQLHAAGANDYWDAATIHPYQDLGWARAGELFKGGEYGQLADVRAAQVAAGDSGKRIWGTEFGWPATPNGVPGGTSESRASFAEQAAWLAPTLTDWHQRPYTGVNFQYHLYDYTSSSKGYRGYGVFLEDGVTRKSSFWSAWTNWLSAR